MGKKKGFIGKFFDEVIKSVDSGNISEKIKIVKDEYQKNLKDIKNQLVNVDEMNKETKINYVSVNEVSVIIKPKIQKSDGKIFVAMRVLLPSEQGFAFNWLLHVAAPNLLMLIISDSDSQEITQIDMSIIASIFPNAL